MTAPRERWPAPSPFAVLAPGHLLGPRGFHGAPVARLEDAGQLAAAAERAGFARVFVHESALAHYGEGWASRGSGSRFLGLGSLRPGPGSRGPEILIPALSNAPRTFAGTRAPIELRWAVELYERAMRFEYRTSAGATGERLLVAVHDRDPRGLRIPPPPPERPADLPPVPAACRPWVWRGEPEAGRRYVHGYDKRAAFLAAAGSDVECGYGEPVELNGAVEFDHRLPGYWRCRLEPEAHQEISRWPLPPQLWAGDWHHTEAVNFAMRDLGRVVKIDRAFVWPEHTRYLRAFAQRIRQAQETIDVAAAKDETTAHAIRTARAAVKDTYKVALGGRLASRVTRGPLGYRPDWAAGLVGRVNANIARAMISLWAAGTPAFALQVDALYVSSDDPDPAAAVAGVLRIGETPGLWRILGTLPMERAAETRTAVELAGAMREQERAGV